MSKVAIKGADTGTGTFTVQSPATNTDRTLTLPDESGTLLNDQSNITTQVKSALNASDDAPIYGCRAWVNFDGSKDSTGAASTANTARLIRASGNVSSVTRNGTGDYTVNFTTAMPDANYCAQCAWGNVSTNMNTAHRVFATDTYTTSSLRVKLLHGTDSISDAQNANVAVFR